MIKKLRATKEIYDIVIRAINTRENGGVPRNDTLQMLLDAGDERLVVVGVRYITAISSLPHLKIY
jgi:sterol 14-demethylase